MSAGQAEGLQHWRQRSHWCVAVEVTGDCCWPSLLLYLYCFPPNSDTHYLQTPAVVVCSTSSSSICTAFFLLATLVIFRRQFFWTVQCDRTELNSRWTLHARIELLVQVVKVNWTTCAVLSLRTLHAKSHFIGADFYADIRHIPSPLEPLGGGSIYIESGQDESTAYWTNAQED